MRYVVGLFLAICLGSALLCVAAFSHPNAALAASDTAEAPRTVEASFFGLSYSGPRFYPPIPFGFLGKGVGTAWGNLEPAKGQFDWRNLDTWVDQARSHHIETMLSFYGVPHWAARGGAFCNPRNCSGPPERQQDFLDFVKAVASRYKGKIKYYELWNEPNARNFWEGSPGDLVKQSQPVYDLIKSTDPSALVMTPGLAADWGGGVRQDEWMRNYLRAGGDKIAEVASYHAHPRHFPRPGACPENVLRCAGDPLLEQARDIKKIFTQYLPGKPVFVTEGGWGNDNFWESTSEDVEQMHAAYVSRWLILLATQVDRAVWWYWQLPGRESAGSGTLWNGESMEPPAKAWQQVYDWLVGATISPCKKSHSVWTCEVARRNGSSALIVWDEKGDSKFTATGYRKMRELSGSSLNIGETGEASVGKQPVLLEK